MYEQLFVCIYFRIYILQEHRFLRNKDGWKPEDWVCGKSDNTVWVMRDYMVSIGLCPYTLYLQMAEVK